MVAAIILAVCASTLTLPLFANADSPMFRVNTSHLGVGTGSPVLNPALLWNYTCNGVVTSSPAVVGGTVYVGSSTGRFYALNALSGTQVWSYSGRRIISSSPAVVGGVVYFGSYLNMVVALNAANGNRLWNYTTGGWVSSSPAVVNGVVYIGCADGNLYALDATNGAKLWSHQFPNQVESSPAVVDGVIYVGCDDGTVYALNSVNGNELWRYSTDWNSATGNAVGSSVAFSEGIVYFGSFNGKVYALNASDGRKLWSYSTKNAVESSPAVYNGVVYIGSFDGNIYALNAATGAEMWSHPTRDQVISSPTVIAGVVYVGSFDGYIYGLNATNGAQLWAYSTGNAIESSPTVNGGILYVGLNNGNVIALESQSTVQTATTQQNAQSAVFPTTLLASAVIIAVGVIASLVGVKKRKTIARSLKGITSRKKKQQKEQQNSEEKGKEENNQELAVISVQKKGSVAGSLKDAASWVKTQNRKRVEKEKEALNRESSTLRWLTFVTTAIAMSAAMSYLPLFPQPLPIIIAVLIAFVTYRYPIIGMPIGGLVIGFGLLYHLSLPPLYFISYLGAERTRIIFAGVWMALFVVLPVIFHRFKSALAIDFGILAVTTLFFSSTYFLAIPLILASAVYFKKYVGLTVIYYVLISIPLQIIQYFEYTVKPIVQSAWWNVPGSSPPLFTNLSQIAPSLTTSMGQFRLYDTSQVVYAITGQLTWNPNIQGRTLGAALSQYLDSAPGILMFVMIIVGFALTFVFFTRILVREGSGGVGDKLFPCLIATMTAAIFFILLDTLALPLAFTADSNPLTLVLGTLATLLLTLPVAFIDTTPKQTATTKQIAEKIKGLLDRTGVLLGQVGNVKANIPVDVSHPDGKLLVTKDSLEYSLKHLEELSYDPAGLNRKFVELEEIGRNLDGTESELNILLAEYQVFVSCEYSNWIGKLKDIGLNFYSILPAEYQKEMPLDARIEATKQILESGRTLAKQLSQVAEPIYAFIRPLYDPSLPEKSRAIEFTKQKLETKEAPWIALDALYNALNNWSRQYGTEILSSMKYLANSIAPIANLSVEGAFLPSAFGNNAVKVLDYAKRAEGMKRIVMQTASKEKLQIGDIAALKGGIQDFLGIACDVLSMLYIKLVGEEDIIDHLLPTKDYLWETNSTLRERLKTATESLGAPLTYKINHIMEKLPALLAYVDEAMQTLAVYDERREFLLNYVTAEAAIEEQLKNKTLLTPKDLPFQPRFANEYLRLYYSQRFGEFSYDKETQQLTKKS